MIEASQNFEQVAYFFAPRVLIIPGILCILIGLYIWLGGLRFNRIIATLVGALVGAILTFCVTEYRIATITLVVLVLAGLSMFFKRATIVVLAAIITAAFVLMISVGPDYRSKNTVPLSEYKFSETRDANEKLNVKESLDIEKLFLDYYILEIKDIAREGSRNPEGLAFSVIGAMVVIVIGVFLSRLTVSATFSLLGTGLVFLGMILVLCYKGAHPISHIVDSPAIYNSVFLVMVIIGAAAGLLLCPDKKKKYKIKRSNGEK
jgi:hypothetical protein